MSSVASDRETPQVSKWVAPDVSASPGFHELISEDSLRKLREDARKAGRTEGLQAGLQEGRAQVRERLEFLERLIAHVAKPLDQLEPEALGAMVELALGVSRVLVNRELSIDESLVLEAVSQALKAVPDGNAGLKIGVNPLDLALVEKVYAEFGEQPNSLIVADPTISRGGAIVESGATLVDSQVETRLSSTLAALLAPAEQR